MAALRLPRHALHPARLRLPTSHHARAFSSTPRPQFLTETTALLTTIHTTTALPWCALIPITAISIRILLTGPLTYTSHLNIQKLNNLKPLITAATHAHHTTLALTEHNTAKTLSKKDLVASAKTNAQQILARHGVKLWYSWLPLLQLPVWFAASFTIRNLTAKKDGALAYLFGDSVATVPAEGVAEEGLFWCTDLVAADPTTALSALLATGLMANVGWNVLAQPVMGKWKTRFTRALGLIAVVSYPLTINMPALLLLYWSTSAWFSVVQNMALQWRFPPVTPVKICSSPDREGLVNRTMKRDLFEKGDKWGGYWGQRQVIGGLQKKEKDS